jgi:hypothetical protein
MAPLPEAAATYPECIQTSRLQVLVMLQGATLA